MADPRVELAREQSDATELANAEAAARMEAVARDAYTAGAAALAVLLARLAKARAAGVTVDAAWVRKVGKLESVLGVTRRALTGYAEMAANTTLARQAGALAQALEDAPALIGAALPDAPPALLDDAFRSAEQMNLDAMLGRLADGTPVDAHFRATIADNATDALRVNLERSIVAGVNPASLAEQYAKEMALAHTRAETIMRTEALRILREATREVYDASPVVETWTWLSALDRRTCPACAIMHGTKHPTTETLDGHPRCRCVMVPDTVSYASLGIGGVPDLPDVPWGGDWVMAMAPDVRRAYLGPGKFAALEDGEITLLDLVARRHDPRWGTMRAERSLVSIREGRNANWGGVGDELGAPPKSVRANS